MKIQLHNIDLLLLPQKAVYLPQYKILCLADWHLGKAAHFRKNGIPLPQPKHDKGFEILENLIATHKPETILFLGDLFHSVKNNEWNAFQAFIQENDTVNFILVKGNHDIFPDEYFEGIGIMVVNELIVDKQLYFTHHPLYGQTPEGYLNIAGHIHPACIIEQKAKQSIRLPCFHYRGETLLLPSFGEMTGTHILPRKYSDIIFCIAGNEILKV